MFFAELNSRGCLDNYKEKLVGMICVDIKVHACGTYTYASVYKKSEKR